jgi:hypothetical protein
MLPSRLVIIRPYLGPAVKHQRSQIISLHVDPNFTLCRCITNSTCPRSRTRTTTTKFHSFFGLASCCKGTPPLLRLLPVLPYAATAGQSFNSTSPKAFYSDRERPGFVAICIHCTLCVFCYLRTISLKSSSDSKSTWWPRGRMAETMFCRLKWLYSVVAPFMWLRFEVPDAYLQLEVTGQWSAGHCGQGLPGIARGVCTTSTSKGSCKLDIKPTLHCVQVDRCTLTAFLTGKVHNSKTVVA